MIVDCASIAQRARQGVVGVHTLLSYSVTCVCSTRIAVVASTGNTYAHTIEAVIAGCAARSVVTWQAVVSLVTTSQRSTSCCGAGVVVIWASDGAADTQSRHTVIILCAHIVVASGFRIVDREYTARLGGAACVVSAWLQIVTNAGRSYNASLIDTVISHCAKITQ